MKSIFKYPLSVNTGETRCLTYDGVEFFDVLVDTDLERITLHQSSTTL